MSELTRAIAEATEGANREGTAKWPECCRDTYSLAIEEIAAALAPLIEARVREARANEVEILHSNVSTLVMALQRRVEEVRRG